MKKRSNSILKKITYTIEYLLLVAVQVVLSVLHRRAALCLGIGLGELLYLSGIYRSVALKNMEHTGICCKESQKALLRKVYRNCGIYAVDFLRKSKTPPPHRIYQYEETVPVGFEKGKGTIALLAHFGNWELLADIFGSSIGKLHVVAKPMHNTTVESWLYKKRSAAQVKTIYTRNALRNMVKSLKNNCMVAILIDQYGGKMGTPVPFLGKEANTVRTVAGLVEKTSCSVLTATALIQKDFSYNIHFINVPTPDTSGLSKQEAITLIQHKHNDVLSELIETHPEHWFGWFHRRFRGYMNY